MVRETFAIIRCLDRGTDGIYGISNLGKKIAQNSAHPRFARALWEANKRGCLDAVAYLCAMISDDLISKTEILDEMAERDSALPVTMDLLSLEQALWRILK